ncbi:hypothetical protein Tco_1056866 [Tanacetum coccineum]|uniref:Uncharacterized protein n=1 Tax=Tanacetum coccineum TaxID=301880 RepID=A0ABQ5H3Z1_9ASTR
MPTTMPKSRRHYRSTTALNMAPVLMAKAFKLNYSTPTNNNQRISSDPRNWQIAQPGMNMGQDSRSDVTAYGGNQFRQYAVQMLDNFGNQNGANQCSRNTNQKPNWNGNIVEHGAEGTVTSDQGEGMLHIFRLSSWIAQTEEAGIQLQAETTFTSGTSEDKAPVYEFRRITERGGTVDQHPATVEETRAYFESLYNNLALEVEKVNLVNRKMKETNADLTTELARYKNQEKCFEISQAKYDKLERCYQKSVYQEQCLTKKINALHLSSGKQITTLNEEISNLSKQLSTEKSTVSSLLEEKKKLKSDFKIPRRAFLKDKFNLSIR